MDRLPLPLSFFLTPGPHRPPLSICMLIPTFLFSTLLIGTLVAVRLHHFQVRLQPVLLPRR